MADEPGIFFDPYDSIGGAGSAILLGTPDSVAMDYINPYDSIGGAGSVVLLGSSDSPQMICFDEWIKSYSPVYDPVTETPTILQGFPGGAPCVAGTTPTVTPISTSPIKRFDPFICEISDDASYVIVHVKFRDIAGPPELAFESTSFGNGDFSSQYFPGSTIEKTSNAYRLTLHRALGWIGDPTFNVTAIGAGAGRAV